MACLHYGGPLFADYDAVRASLPGSLAPAPGIDPGIVYPRVSAATYVSETATPASARRFSAFR